MSRSGWPASPGGSLARAVAPSGEPRLDAGAGRAQRVRHSRGQRGHRDRGDLAPQPHPRNGGRDAAPVQGNAAGGRRDVGRQADQPPLVQPGLADWQRGLALRGRRRLPRPDRPGHRGHPPDDPVQPAGLRPAGRRREHGVGGVVLRRRRDRPARLRRPDARPGRVGAGARHRRGVQPGPGRAGRRARRQALRGRGRHRGHRGPGRPPGDAPDLPDRGPGQLGGGLARRQQALCRNRPLQERSSCWSTTSPPASRRPRPRPGGRYREPSRDRWRRLGHDGNRDEQWAWFAPGGDLARSFRVSQGAGAGFSSVPVYSGGVVWVGGSHELSLCQPGHRPRAGAHAHPRRPRRRGVLRQPHRAEQRPHLRPVPGQRGSPGRPGQPHAAPAACCPG